MQLPLKVCVFVLLGLINPLSVSLSALPEDMEGSGYNQDGSGSGDGSELASRDEIKSIKFGPDTKGGSSGLTFDNIYWPTGDDVSESALFSNSKSFLNNPEILAGFIVGGVVGAIIGATISSVLIYRQIKKDKERSLKKTSLEDYHKPIREEAFV